MNALILKEHVLRAKNIYLYGAGTIAYNVRIVLEIILHMDIKAHIVTQLNPKEHFFQGKPVLGLQDLPDQMTGDLILIATPPVYHEEIVRSLVKQTSCPFILLDDFLQYSLLSAYYRRMDGFKMLDELSGGMALSTKSIEIYMAKSAKDKNLHQQISFPQHIYPVQVGAALDGICIPVRWHDDDGENISLRNRDFSEMTVAYWAWKNRRADYMGLCHYRRVLALSDDDYVKIIANDVDVVLGLPYICAGDASFQYGRYISDEDMRLLYSVLTSEEETWLRRELGRPYLYNHNLFLAKREIFADYCERIFSILSRVEKKESQRPWRNDRHMGYLAEILTSAYFTSRTEELQMVHAPDLWLA